MSTPGFPIPILSINDPLPQPATALGSHTEWPGLVAAGVDLSANRLIEAYRMGIFPWYHQDQLVLWWSTDPRMVLLPNNFKLHRSFRKALAKALKSEQLEIRIDHDFEQLVKLCAVQKRPGQNGTWIHPEMVAAYSELHQRGHAHSVETWINGKLVGGLYCVSIGHAIFGESMFTLEPNASKFALAALVSFCLFHGIWAIDCQQQTKHLASLGAVPIDRLHFLNGLQSVIDKPAPKWEFLPVYWNQILTTQ